MDTNVKDPLNAPLRLAARSALPLLALVGWLASSSDAAAQGQPQPWGQPPGAQPGGFGAQPQPWGQPQPGAQPQPWGQPQPGAQPQPWGQPQPGTQPGQTGQPGVSFGADASLGGDGLKTDAQVTPETPAASTDAEDAERALSLMEQPNLWGSTGLQRTSYAGSGAKGTFRVSFMMDWFSTSSFLCDPDTLTAGNQLITCSRASKADDASHVGAFFTLNATPFSFLEAYASIRTYANSNSEGSPALLQVLGDTTIGVKAFTPPKLGKILTFGGEVQLMLLNGTGDVGVAGSGTSVAIRGLASADFRKPEGKGAPFRINVNAGYKFDNSGNLVEDVEIARAKAFTDGRDTQPISRIERYGLGINRVDFIQLNVGLEAPFKKFQPFVEYSLDVPYNRQDYACHPTRVSRGDVCLGLDKFNVTPEQAKTQGGPGYAAFPSRLSIGARVNPFEKAFRGLSATAAFDIGLSGTSVFIDEVAPQAPWTLYLGLGYSFDTKEKAPPAAPPAPPAPPPKLVPAPQNFIRGFVHEQGKQDPIAEALVTFATGVQPPLATGPDGRFLTRHLEPGSYPFSIKAIGFMPGTCQGTVVVGGAAPGFGGQPGGGFGQPGGGFGQPGGGFGQPGGGFGQPTGGFGQPTGGFGQPTGGFGQPTGGFGQPNPFGQPQPNPFGQQVGQPGMPPQAPQQQAPQGPTVVDIDCPLQALPRLGNIVGTVKDAGEGAAVAGAVVRMTDATGKQSSATTDGNGSFRFNDVPPGNASFKVEAPGFMVHANQTEVRASEDARVTLNLNKRPKISLVKVQGNEIKISRQIHFETGSAKILGDSNDLMEEIADVMTRNPNIKKVEIQGHTDNTGGREANQVLSDNRAKSVRDWLVAAGIDTNRLAPKGYGQERPLAPNITAANKARNRRVQFIILEK